MKCIQCESLDCGPYRCRFTNVEHERFRKQRAYGDVMAKRDREQPKWERDLATGALDPANTWNGRYT